MVGADGDALESLLTDFDQIFQDCRDGLRQLQELRMNCDSETKKREALECSVRHLKSENERLVKLYTESFNRLADQLQYRSNCWSLEEELERVKDELISKEIEYQSAVDSLKQERTLQIKDLETQISGFLLERQANEATIIQLHQDLAAHKNHIEALSKKLEQVHHAVEAKYNDEIQDLKDCLLVEQEEKNELNLKLHHLEKELLTNRLKSVENQQDLTSTRHLETLKQKIMKLRSENGILKSQLHGSKAN